MSAQQRGLEEEPSRGGVGGVGGLVGVAVVIPDAARKQLRFMGPKSQD